MARVRLTKEIKEQVAETQKAFKEFALSAENGVEEALLKAAMKVERDAKKSFRPSNVPSEIGQFPRSQTGRLRASITHRLVKEMGEVAAEVGTNVEYACILSPNTKIVTSNGLKRISDIIIGDMVLTQTGEYRKVLDTIKNKAIDIPNMVTIKCEWRSDRSHDITVTDSHKILVNRDGRTKWVESKDILITDKVYIRKKIPINKGVKKYPPKHCLYCNQEYTTQGTKFCCMNCKIQYHREYGNPNTGSKRTEETRRKQSLIIKTRHELYPESHPNRKMAKKGFRTSTEKKVAEWLDSRGLVYLEQYKIGRHFVDFYIPETGETYEADGAYWHKSFEKDIERDKDIISIMPDIKIHHIHFYDKRHSPENIDPNPIENVYYIVCNPHTESFCNLDIFETSNIISIEKWIYTKSTKKHASRDAFVYDLSIDGIHSYVASGIVVSNSWLEFGTTKMYPHPFMTPAFESNKEAIKEYIAKAVKKAADDAGR